MSNLSIASYFPFMRVKIIEQNVHQQAPAAMIKLTSDGRYRPLCHDCGQRAATVHFLGHRRIIRDLNMATAQVWLNAEYRRVWCEQCGGARVGKSSFCEAGKRVTHRLARYVHELCNMLTLSEVAEHLDFNPKTVKEIDRTFLEQEFAATDYQGLRILALDEIALRKGAVLKGSRYLLLKNSENLTDQQANRLQKILALNETLNTVYVLKDQLKMFYFYSDRDQVKLALDDWCRMAETVDRSAMGRFINCLRFFEYGILNHADFPIDTSRLEGVNNKIKLIKRKAYGFHGDEYFILKVKQAFSGEKSTTYFG